MKEITITDYGHACYKVECGADSILFDPYADDNVPGLRLPRGIRVSKVYCSHGHGDHNARELVEETAILKDPFEIEFITVPHDDCDGTKRGMNEITIVNVEGTKVVHFGDIGRLPDEEEYDALKGADIIFIPCGGHFTIDAVQAKEIIERLQPSLSILMHYRSDSFGYDVLAHINEIASLFANLEQLPGSTYVYDGSEQGRIITLSPKQ